MRYDHLLLSTDMENEAQGGVEIQNFNPWGWMAESALRISYHISIQYRIKC